MALNWTEGELAAGLDCYRKAEFFEAHEHWEALWRQTMGAEKPFLQALIQMAGAFHHHRRRNLRGTAALLRAALRRLEPYPERFGGVLLGPLRQELCGWLRALDAQEPSTKGAPRLPPYPDIRLDPAPPEPDQSSH